MSTLPVSTDNDAGPILLMPAILNHGSLLRAYCRFRH